MPPSLPIAAPSSTLGLLGRMEMALIAALAILLPFDHWFFGHIVNPAPMRVVGMALCVVWLAQLAMRQLRFVLTAWHGLVLVFLAATIFSALASPLTPAPTALSLQSKLVASSKIAAAMLFFVLASQALDLSKIRFFLRIHLVNGAVICTLSLVLYFLHQYRIWPHNFALWVDPDIYNFARIQGVSFEPHRFGAYTLSLLPFFLLRELRENIGWRCTALDLPLLLVISIAAILSYAVSALLVLPVMLGLLYGTSPARRRQLLWLLLGLTVLIAVLLAIPAVRDATFEIIEVKMRGQSLNSRFGKWIVAVFMFLFFPWTGVGPEGYSYFYPWFDHSVKVATPASHPPQSIFFGLLANQGLFGVLSFFAVIGTFATGVVRRIRNLSSEDRVLPYALAVIALTHFLLQFAIWLPWSLNQWLYMAMAWAALASAPASSGRHSHAQS
jgi:O-antigen ligase